jgi:hypothetical protein
MSRARQTVPPRLLGAEAAAAYCGVGITLFRRECPISPVRLGERVLWDVRALDCWIDSLNSARKESGVDSRESIDMADIAVKELAEHAKAKKKDPGRRH